MGRIFSRSLGSPPAAGAPHPAGIPGPLYLRGPRCPLPACPLAFCPPGSVCGARVPASAPRCYASNAAAARPRASAWSHAEVLDLLSSRGRGDSTGPRCGSHVPCVAGQGLAPLLAHTGWRQHRCLHACFPPCPLILRPLSSPTSPMCPPAPSPSAPTPMLLTFHPHPPPRPLSRSPGGHRSHCPWQAVGEDLGAGRRPRGCLCPGLSAPTSFLLYGKAGNFCRAKAGLCGFNGVVRAAAAGARDPPGTSPALTAGCGAVGTSTRDAQEPRGLQCCTPGFALCLLRGAEQLTAPLRASVSPLGVGPGGLGSPTAPHGHRAPSGSPARLE